MISMRASILLSVCLPLTGCSLFNDLSVVTDTLRAGLAKPADIVLSDQAKAAFPYAAMTLRAGDAPLALIVLARQGAGVSHYATREGHLVSFREGRLFLTQGFPDDIFWARRLPLPSAALGRATPLCWSSGWRVSGEHEATLRLSGCLREMPSASGQRLVVETVQVPSMPSLRHENRYFFTPGGTWQSAEFQPGPGMPRWKVAVWRDEPQSTQQPVMGRWADGPVTLQISGVVQRREQTVAKVSALTAPLADLHDIDWTLSRLYRTDPDRVRPLEQQRQQVLDLLDAQLAATTRGAYASQVRLRRARLDVQSWRLAQPVDALLNPDWLLLNPSRDLALRGSQYWLHVADSKDLPVPRDDHDGLPPAIVEAVKSLSRYRLP